jgi:hypothetical protein
MADGDVGGDNPPGGSPRNADAKIGDRLQIALQNTNLSATLTAPIWCLSPISTSRERLHMRVSA